MKRTFPGFVSEDEEGGSAMANDVGDAAEARLAGVPPSQYEFDCARRHPPLLISSEHLILLNTVFAPSIMILLPTAFFSCLHVLCFVSPSSACASRRSSQFDLKFLRLITKQIKCAIGGTRDEDPRRTT
jgi:hypothetical protein